MSYRRECTVENLYRPIEGVRWMHPQAVVVDSKCDCCEAYKCPLCGLDFKVELPQ